MTKYFLLDLFSGAGGCTKGYQLAGFTVIGVDISNQPHYIGDGFILGDALLVMDLLLAGSSVKDGVGRDWYLSDFAAIHASPPCQFASVETRMEYRANHKNYIPEVRSLLVKSNKPYVIENVENARRHLNNPIKLCGSMFGLGVWRHRYFECPALSVLTPTCNHSGVPVLISGTPRRNGNRKEFTAQQRRDASGLHWMTRVEMDQAIPPAFTKFVGDHLMTHLNRVST